MDSDRMQQKDLVLNVNEYAYVLDQTKGNVVCWVGPSKTSLSNSDQLVTFNEKTKRFEPCNFQQAIKLFTTAPKGWYIVLKNPTKDKHPQNGTSNNIPEGMEVGKKINIEGPVSFALYPGQMAKVIKGHILRSNQYIMVRVYDAEAAAKLSTDPEASYTPGQMMVIKGTEVSFYIPPTGFEIVQNDGAFVQDAVTLEKLEYCILKDENGNKRYVQGPAVVFPEPTESFIKNDDGSFKFKAIELSKISGIYIKVIEEYIEGETTFKAGDELFITGEDQMIYFPRPEHAIIQYGQKLVHHAIAIPKGEGRYIMNRMTGEIKTVIGSKMLLPDPREEVVIKRKLSRNQCELWYPGNREVLEYNGQLDTLETAHTMEVFNMVSADDVGQYTSVSNSVAGRAGKQFKVGDAFARGTEYSKPRTITLDTKYDGVVKLDVWTGYAVNVVSSDGARRVVVGPQSVLLNYDETLEVLSLSTGKPKNTDYLEKSVYLRCENNNIGDIISVETSDYISVDIKLSYIVDFDKELQDKWFAVENYVKFLCDHMRSILKTEVKKYTIAEFYANSTPIIKAAVLKATDEYEPAKFSENGMIVKDVEILKVAMDENISYMIDNYQQDIIRKTLELSTAEQANVITKQIEELKMERDKVEHAGYLNGLALDREKNLEKLTLQAELHRLQEEENDKQMVAKKAQQVAKNEIEALERENDAAGTQAELDEQQAIDNMKIAFNNAKTANMKEVMAAISPDLIQAMQDKTNAELVKVVTESMSPYAIAGEEGVVDVTERLLRGTPLDNVIKGMFSTEE